MSTSMTPPPAGAAGDQRQEPTIGSLVNQLTQDVPELIRSEVRLAQAELAQKGKRLGIGAGLFGAAGVLGFVALQLVAATAVLALALVLDAWLAALIVTVVFLAAAAIAALVGRKEVAEGTPPTPERAIEGIKADVDTLKGGHRPPAPAEGGSPA